MSSPPPPPPPPRSQRPLHNFELPSDLKWSTKSQSTNNPTRRRWRRLMRETSSSSSRQQPQSANAIAAASSEQSSPKESVILDWLHENLSKPSSGSSSLGSSPRPSGQTTANSDATSFKASPSQSRDISGSPLQKASPLRIKISTSGTTSRVQSSFHPWHAPKSGSSSGRTSPLLGFHVDDKESSCIDLLKSGFAVDNVDKGKNTDSKGVSFASEKMIEMFEKTLSVSDMNEETNKEDKHEDEGLKEEKKPANIEVKIKCEGNKQELQNKTGKKEEKPLKTYVRNPKKKGQSAKEKKLEIVVPKKEKDEDYKPVIPESNDSDDLDEKIWNLRTRKPNRQTGVLNLDKNMGSSSKDQGESVQKKKEKQIREDGESKSGDKKKNAKENKKEKKKKKNKKNNGKAPNRETQQEQQTEFRLPKFSLQLTPQEISDDLFAMTGTRPPRRPQKRPKSIQRHVDVSNGLIISLDIF